jgi:hypothetical protein
MKKYRETMVDGKNLTLKRQDIVGGYLAKE